MIFNLKFIVDGSIDKNASIEVIFLERIYLLDPGSVSKKFIWLEFEKIFSGDLTAK
jgi:hypothetical protein